MMKKLISKVLRNIMPFKYYKLLVNGFIIVPKYYRQIIKENELYFNYSLEDSNEKDILLLRKYGHIIDKGLHREDVAPGHSKKYILLLERLLYKLKNTKYAEDPTYKWAESKYFAYKKLQDNPSGFIPFRGIEESPAVTYNDLLSLIKQRRSNRFFKDEVVSDDIIKKLEITLNWSASSCNKQPNELYYTNNPSIAKECLKCCKGGTGFSEFIPCFCVFTADCLGYVWPSEMFLPYIDLSLGAQNFFLSCTTFGISGTILSWAQKDEREELRLREILNIPKEKIIIFCAVIGYAKNIYVTPNRKL